MPTVPLLRCSGPMISCARPRSWLLAQVPRLVGVGAAADAERRLERHLADGHGGRRRRRVAQVLEADAGELDPRGPRRADQALAEIEVEDGAALLDHGPGDVTPQLAAPRLGGELERVDNAVVGTARHVNERVGDGGVEPVDAEPSVAAVGRAVHGRNDARLCRTRRN